MTRPQKSNDIRSAERRKLSTWIPPNGTGIGLWKGRRVYYVNGKRQSGLTIRNPIGDSIGNTLKGLTIQGAKDLYTITGARSIVENPGSLGILDPRVWQAAVRTKKNLAQLGVKPPKKQSKEVLERIAQNQAKLMKEGFGTKIETKEVINNDKKKVKEVIKNEQNPEIKIQAQNTLNVLNKRQSENNAGMPTDDNVVETPPPKKTAHKGRTRWVGKNTTWIDRHGNVIAPKENSELDFKQRRNMFQLTEEERKKVIMTSLEQEMYW